MAKTVKNSQGIETLRQLVANQMDLENHGYTDAARAIGVTDGAVHQFLHHNKGASVEMCLKLAAYLRLSAEHILRLAGHDDVADLLPVIATIPAEANDLYAAAFSRIAASLTPDETEMVLTQARQTARLLLRDKPSPEVPDDRPAPAKKPYHRRRKRA